jgi:hypothetical protein
MNFPATRNTGFGTVREAACHASQNPKYFRPELRLGLKQRQDAVMRQRHLERQQAWSDWEREAEEDEKRRREAAAAAFARRQSARGVSSFQRAAGSTYRRDSREVDRWPQAQALELAEPNDDDEAIGNPRSQQQQGRPRDAPFDDGEAAQRQPNQVAASRARQRLATARISRQAESAALPKAYWQGRLNEKMSRFGDLVEAMRTGYEEQDPFRSRQQDPIGAAAAQRAALGRRGVAKGTPRRRQEDAPSWKYSELNAARRGWRSDLEEPAETPLEQRPELEGIRAEDNKRRLPQRVAVGNENTKLGQTSSIDQRMADMYTNDAYMDW